MKHTGLASFDELVRTAFDVLNNGSSGSTISESSNVVLDFEKRTQDQLAQQTSSSINGLKSDFSREKQNEEIGK
jgi:hypothetical protein